MTTPTLESLDARVTALEAKAGAPAHAVAAPSVSSDFVFPVIPTGPPLASYLGSFTTDAAQALDRSRYGLTAYGLKQISDADLMAKWAAFQAYAAAPNPGSLVGQCFAFFDDPELAFYALMTGMFDASSQNQVYQSRMWLAQTPTGATPIMHKTLGAFLAALPTPIAPAAGQTTPSGIAD